MSINIKQVLTTSGQDSTFSLLPTIQLGTTYVLICITMQPSDNQELTELLFGLLGVQILQECQLRNGAKTIIAAVPNPALGLVTIAGTFSANVKHSVTVILIEGVTNCYFSTNGVGQGIDSLPIKVTEKNGTLVIGAGLAEGSESAIVEVWQTELWNVAHPNGGFKSQGIMRLADQDIVMEIPNKLTAPCNWAIAVVGLEP